MKQAFNKRIPAGLVKRVKATAKRSNVTEDLVVETALRFFFDNTNTSKREDAFMAVCHGQTLCTCRS